MKWTKAGLVYGPPGGSWWARRGALQPTPLLRADGAIRVFAGFRTDDGVSRVGYVDLSAASPTRVLGVSRDPVLDIGAPGAFDENGVVPCAIVQRPEGLYLYYAGYQLGQRVRFTVYGGLALSTDGGETFTRYSRVPITDRTDDELLFRVIHTMMFDGGRWRAWYGAGSEFNVVADRQLPIYDIRHAEAPNGLTLDRKYELCIGLEGREHRVGRPYVIKHDGAYKMFFATGTATEGYRLAYAVSADGLNWERRQDELGIGISSSGWDSAMQAYPSVVVYNDTAYLFYNGNNYGDEGFGLAVLESW